jgi:hypothetical protein
VVFKDDLYRFIKDHRRRWPAAEGRRMTLWKRDA